MNLQATPLEPFEVQPEARWRAIGDLPGVLLRGTRTRRIAAARAAYRYGRLVSSDEELAQLLFAGARHRWRSSARTLSLMSHRRRAALQVGIEASGAEHLQAAASRGRGVVIASAHLSDVDLAGSWLSQTCELEVVAVAGGACGRLRGEAFKRIRQACGVAVRHESSTRISDLCADLARGRVVVIMLDRRPRRGGVPVELLGRPAVVSAAPLILAIRTGAPVLVAAMTRQRSGGYLAQIAPAPQPTPAHSGCWTQALVAQLGKIISSAPDQWHIPPDFTELAWVDPDTDHRRRSSPDAVAPAAGRDPTESTDPPIRRVRRGD